MKIKILIFFTIVLSVQLFSQESLFEKDIKLKSGLNDIGESLPIVNDEKNEIALFLLDKVMINSFLFSKDYKILDSFSVPKPETTFHTLLGYSVDSVRYHLFFTNNRQNKFHIKSINISRKVWHGTTLDFKLKNEKILESLNYNNKFYLMTIKKYSSILKLYVFESDKLIKKEQFDFSSYKFSNSSYYKLYDVFRNVGISKINTLEICKIDNGNPNPLDLTSKANKIHYFNDKIFITIDNSLKNTKMITIDLVDFSSNVHFYKQSTTECFGVYDIKSNSYLFNEKLFQIKGCKKELYFQILDHKKDSVLKEFRVKEHEEITFKNTPLIQKGGTTIFTSNSEKELDKTKKILRKISTSDIGVTASNLQENIVLTIGGYKEVERMSGGGGMMMTSSGTTISTPHGNISIHPTYHYNPTMYGYNTYTNTRSVYFKTLLNDNLNHIPGDVPDNAYDKIKDYEEEKDEKIICKTIFKVDNYYVFGYYVKWDKKYCLIKFEN